MCKYGTLILRRSIYICYSITNTVPQGAGPTGSILGHAGILGKLFAEHTAMKIIEGPPYNKGFPVAPLLTLANAQNVAFCHLLPCLCKLEKVMITTIIIFIGKFAQQPTMHYVLYIVK
jgi:hypothetical protein